MTIVVTTPTGHVGVHVTRQLIQAGECPRLLLRDASRLSEEVRAAVDVVELDQGNVAAVRAATEGASALFWVDPPTDDDDPIAGYARMGASAAEAVRANGIPRMVFQSSGGAEHRHGYGEIDGLGRTEELLDATEESVIHLRCGYFFTNLLMDLASLRAGTITTTLPLDLRMPWVDPLDIATVATGRLLSTSWSGRVTQGVHGPADLSYTEVAAILTDALGTRITATQVTDADVASQLEQAGLGPAQVDGIVGMSRGIRENRPPADPRSALTTTPTSLAAWAFATLRPLLG